MTCQGTSPTDGNPHTSTFSLDANGNLQCSLDGAAPVTLISGVTALNIRYGVGSGIGQPNSAGTPDSYLTAADMNAVPLRWTNVYTRQSHSDIQKSAGDQRRQHHLAGRSARGSGHHLQPHHQHQVAHRRQRGQLHMNRHSQRGMALVSAMLLLIVMTILAISMFRTFGTQEKIAGNTREKQRAIHTADSAEAYAEWWLSSQGGINATAGVACTGLAGGNADQPHQVCSTPLNTVVPGADVSVVPWTVAGTPVGFTYTPTGFVTTAGTTDSYFQSPRLYISYISGFYNSQTGVQSSSYLIDAAGWGGTPTSVSVVETSYIVNKMYTTQGQKARYINLGAP